MGTVAAGNGLRVSVVIHCVVMCVIEGDPALPNVYNRGSPLLLFLSFFVAL